jgi:restriction system protein
MAKLKLQDDPMPTHLDLMRPTLEALKALGGSGSNEEIYDKLVEREGFSEEMQNIMLPSGTRAKLWDRAAWARSYLKLVGALIQEGRGTWSIPPGEEMTDEQIAQRVKQMLRKGYEERKKNKQEDKPQVGLRASKQEITDGGLTEDAEDTASQWQENLLEVLSTIKPDAFERLCQLMLRESGFIKVQVTGKTGDGGIDGIGVLKINLLSFTVFFQCKRYKGSVGAGAIRDFRGAMMGRADKGLVITTGSFTTDARKEATRDGATAIELVDGEELANLLKRHKLGVITEMVEQVTLIPEFFQTI